MKYKPYPAYKNSGVEWLGEVPEEWEIKPLKHLVSMNSGDQITAEAIRDEGTYPVFGGNGLRGYTEQFTHEGRFPLVGRQGALCGNVNYSWGKFWASEHAVVVSPKIECAVIWIGELLRSMELGQYSITAAQPGLSVEAIGNLRVPYPNPREQTAIAIFLDREITKLDTLINKHEKLIELLQEKRQALISHAVTKGLNPDVPMKDSGVEWIGKVPAHWDITRIGRLFEIQKRIVGELGHDVLSITQRGIRIKDTESNEGQLSMNYSKYQTVEVGDFAMNHMDLITGFIDVAKFPGVTSPDYRVFRLKALSDADSRYFLAVFQDAYRRKLFFPFGQGSSQLGRWRLPTDAFKEYRIPVPPKGEQTDIAIFIDQENTKIDTLIEKSRRSIKLMREHRTALISAAVTGKIDVREAA